MIKSTFWGLALVTAVAGGAVAASTIAPALTRADGEESEVIYALNPEDGAIVNDLQTITISFENKTVQTNTRMEGTTIVLTNTDTGVEYYCDEPVQLDRVTEGVAYQLNFLTQVENGEEIESVLEPITTPGAYTLSITANSFLYGDEVEDEEGNVTLENVVPVQAINATYTLVEATPKVAYALDPEDEAIVNDLQTITISFEDASVQVNSKMEASAIVLTNTETREEYYCDGPLRDTRVPVGVAYQLNFLTQVEDAEGNIESVLKPITTPGTYTLSIVASTFLCGEDAEKVVPVEAINATYTLVEATPKVAYALDPEDEAIVNDLQTITVSFENKNVQPNERMESTTIVLTNTETGVEYYCDGPVRDTTVPEGVAYKLTFLTLVENEEGNIESVAKPITTPGNYTLSIAANTFLCGEEVEDEEGNVTVENFVPVQAINATYTLVEATPKMAYTLDPEDGAIVNDLQTIIVSFENKNVQPNERMESTTIVLTNTETGEEYYCDGPVRADRAVEGVAYQLTFLTLVEDEEGNIESVAEPITTPGNYTLSIAANTFICGNEVEDEEGNVTLENVVPVQAINATYKLVEAAPEVAYTLDPEDEAIVNDLQTITVSFENKNVLINDRMEFNAIVLTNTETGEEYYCDAPLRDTSVPTGVSYKLNFLTTVEDENGFENVFEPITTPGNYTLSILANTFICADEVEDEEGNVTLENVVPVQAINATYTLVEAVPEVAYTLDPEDGETLTEIPTITISFESNHVQINERMETTTIVLTNNSTGVEYYCDGPVRLDRTTEGVAYQLTFLTLIEDEEGNIEAVAEPITTPGTYTLSIAANTFLSGEEVEDEEGNVTVENFVPVQAIYATYTISSSTGVNSVFGTDATEFDVYTVNGVQVLKAADSNAVNALPKGLYIINGKKVIKK